MTKEEQLQIKIEHLQEKISQLCAFINYLDDNGVLTQTDREDYSEIMTD